MNNIPNLTPEQIQALMLQQQILQNQMIQEANNPRGAFYQRLAMGNVPTGQGNLQGVRMEHPTYYQNASLMHPFAGGINDSILVPANPTVQETINNPEQSLQIKQLNTNLKQQRLQQ